ncbi:thrombospondin type 1 domain protein [Gregarina niphandrodes]|uniref:Thrombospondin type 1 domain protein n=1 Tax=Gregarina niphandrodes TaxID=110365 RepID=A0A023BD67_GRENI|nr:thrombospondin type 1 domain protein [Gregarina niphandrodes]EZG87454.1 thrombospondin type 1 domain protein [Gregarina niphandrodes]|eukprot:XP_011128659.1 thrombospondin type 1 domain protein [Gregarina niphandrodes]
MRWIIGPVLGPVWAELAGKPSMYGYLEEDALAPGSGGPFYDSLNLSAARAVAVADAAARGVTSTASPRDETTTSGTMTETESTGTTSTTTTETETTWSSTSASCEYGAWGEWSGCPCDAEKEYSNRTVVKVDPEAVCEADVRSRACEPNPCDPCTQGIGGDPALLACNRRTSTCSFEVGYNEYNYRCRCFVGYQLMETAEALPTGCKDCCVDIDECADPVLNQCSDVCEDGLAQPQNYTCSCQTGRYAVDARSCGSCQYSQWSAWTDCSVQCGTGETSRHKTPVDDSVAHPDVCQTITESDQCTANDCNNPDDCHYTSWSDFGDCDQECGGGKQTRTRTLANGPDLCEPELFETMPCNTEPCATSGYRISPKTVVLCALVVIFLLVLFSAVTWFWWTRQAPPGDLT